MKQLALLVLLAAVLVGCSSNGGDDKVYPAGPDPEAAKKSDSVPSSLPPEARDAIRGSAPSVPRTK